MKEGKGAIMADRIHNYTQVSHKRWRKRKWW